MPPASSTAASSDLDLLQGTLDVMILKALSWGAMHGFGVAKWIRHTTDEVLQIEDSALYPALHRMEHRGLISADWGLTENKRRAPRQGFEDHDVERALEQIEVGRRGGRRSRRHYSAYPQEVRVLFNRYPQNVRGENKKRDLCCRRAG